MGLKVWSSIACSPEPHQLPERMSQTRWDEANIRHTVPCTISPLRYSSELYPTCGLGRESHAETRHRPFAFLAVFVRIPSHAA